MVPFSADTGLKVCVGIFFLSSFFLASSYNATYAFDRPVSTSVLVCFLLGAVFSVLGRFVPSVSRPLSPTRKRPGIPLADQFELPSRVSSSSPILGPQGLPPPRTHFWLKFGLLLGIFGLRVELFRRVTLHNECAPTGYAYAIPFVISLYDYLAHQRLRSRDGYSPLQTPQNLSSNVAYYVCRRGFYNLTQGRFRGVFSAALISVGGYAASSLLAGSQSTYICPIVLNGAARLQTMRAANVVIDSILLIGIAELCRSSGEIEEAGRKRAIVSLGAGLLIVAIVWTIIGHFVSNSRPEHSGQPFLDAKYSRSAFGQAMLVVFFVLSAWQMLPHFGILGLSILGGFVFVFFPATSTLLFEQMPFPHISQTHAVVPLIASSTGVILFLFSRILSEDESKPLYRTNIVLQILFLVIGGIGLIFATTKHQFSHTHPIDLLIHKGTIHYDNYLLQASASKNLEEAIWEYRKRYRQHPPPGFDKWFEYAVNRSSIIIDDFDQIYENLLPFRAIRPAEIREMTQKLATNPFNDLGAISIRAGQVRVQEGIKPTHAWMVKGAAQMIENFAQHLPDMDLVFNLNDEPRVAVPWEKMLLLNQAARAQKPVPQEELLDRWSGDRELGWGPIEPADQTNETIFTDGAWRGIFDPYVSAVCPPSSRVRTGRVWNRHDICLSCAAPHTMGQFPLDFNLATEICHQPDLAFLHGLLISPASFKVSQDLIPVFSQSALAGFNDILFPSPWNYMDKVEYKPSKENPDPEYGQKDNSLFWVGSTSEGYSRFNEWKGMPRQRFSHLINNNTHSQVSVLLPAGPGSYQYKIMDGFAPTKELNLRTNVHIADPITRCGDCDTQRDELGTSGRVDFQAHWSYRYLFDLDGAGFSGRFLPFLQSHSLPLRTGLFRQWFDSRVISWLHFVPIDIRLHGLWSTLAYFAGVPNPKPNEHDPNGAPMIMDAHVNEGWWIAEQGRKWTEVALRKEDMEIYFFRLLLEWGRLTDDQRDVLGYRL
ncbi:uncharacterized protein N7482_008107 [Penicillium canariense]|uniref:Glycosyl transferase CAP10 domain-containing protein n=1 Tax=Penicillium canariense TaxID=189055 RepID=A0A9W9HTB3_9EURO|nr:uncharacterized protein N7482_008107 [Penicillium canariense]KAJ5157007.1 hypothetical protein N7482_008107 [Penicillium canariense]